MLLATPSSGDTPQRPKKHKKNEHFPLLLYILEEKYFAGNEYCFH